MKQILAKHEYASVFFATLLLGVQILLALMFTSLCFWIRFCTNGAIIKHKTHQNWSRSYFQIQRKKPIIFWLKEIILICRKDKVFIIFF